MLLKTPAEVSESKAYRLASALRKRSGRAYACRHAKNKNEGADEMRFVINGKNLEVTDSLRTAVTEKLSKLERYFTPETEIIVTMSVEKERQKIEVTIPVKGTIIRTEQVSNDMYMSIDLAQEVIERQLRRYRQKLKDRYQSGGGFQPDYLEKAYEEEDEVKIIRSKRFDIKPMYPEDACVQIGRAHV